MSKTSTVRGEWTECDQPDYSLVELFIARVLIGQLVHADIFKLEQFPNKNHVSTRKVEFSFDHLREFYLSRSALFRG